MKKVTEKREIPHNSIHTKKSYRIQNEPLKTIIMTQFLCSRSYTQVQYPKDH